MKLRITDLLHGTPWWALLASGLALTLALAVFVTPFHLIKLEKSGATPAENRAIKREIDAAFSEGAIDMARGIVSEMRERAKDPARREELDRALDEIDRARDSMREAGQEVLRAKREAAAGVSEAVSDAANAIREAQKEAAGAVRDSGPQGERLRQSLEDSLKAAQQAEDQAKRLDEPTPENAKDAAAKAADARPTDAKPTKKSRMVIVGPGSGKPMLDIDMSATPTARSDLPPEVRREIREKLSTDLWRIGVGSGVMLIFLPLFILTVVSKFFIDRSRAAQRMVDMKKREAEYHSMRRQVTEAKLSALQAQVEPHFLYNTLASVQALTEVDPKRASDMTGHLIHYLRNALPKMRESISTVGQEVELARAYLNILQMRMGKRLGFEIEVPPELLDAPFPPLMLPSLVENAIKHGLEPLREGGTVRITAEAAEGRVRLRVADTGRGFADAPGSGVGLSNIRERLAGLYGNDAHLTLEANSPQGAIATIEIPRTVPAEQPAAAPAPASASATASQPALAQESVSSARAEISAEDVPPTRMRRFLRAAGRAERAWRRGLTYAFMVLATVAAMLCVLGAIGVATGVLPLHIGNENIGGAAGALIGMAAFAVAFVALVLALVVVLSVLYALGFVLAGVFIIVAIAVAISLFPVMAPFILLALGIAWLVRRMQRKPPTLESADAHRDPR